MNEDNAKVTVYIIENGLSTPLPSSKEDIEELIFRKILEIDYFTGELKLCSRNKEEYSERINEYREMFHPTNIGYPGKYDSPKNIIEKFRKFFKLHPDYSFDDVLKATKEYIQKNITKPMYIMKASNFIYKREAGVWKSVLLDNLEENKESVTKTQNLFL